MFRKLGIGFAALAMLAPSLALALGVGEYQLESYLNQPFKMEVELLDTGDLSEDEILASLAAQEDFSAAGVERVYFLTDLNFAVSLDNNGGGTLTVTSAQPVREPFLNFLVEFLWPTGRLLREYTVLLDPPAYRSEEAAAAPAPAAVQSAPVAPAPSEPVVAPAETVQSPRIVAQSQPTKSQTAAIEVTDRQQYVVQNDDTMWRIALNNRPAQSISVQQMLVAIQTLNENAFIDGNVNLVREGTVLRLPTEEEVRRISTRDALTEIADQNRQWRAKLEARGITLPARPQLDATRRSSDRSSKFQSAPKAGKVTLVAPDAEEGDGSTGGAAGTGSGAGKDGRALENELAIRDENVDQLSRENSELSSRLQDLTQQVNTSEQLLQLRNDQIAQLQDQLRKLREEKGAAPVEPIELESVAPVTDVTPTVSEEAEAASAPQSEEPGADQGDAVAEAEEGVVDNGSETSAAGEALDQADVVAGQEGVEESADTSATAEAAEPVAEVAEAVPAPKPVVPPAPVAQPSFLEENLMLVVLGGVLVVVLVFGGLFIAARRRKADGEDLAEEDDHDYGDADDFIAMGESDEEEGELDGLDLDGDQSTPDLGQDPLEEVEVYTAYGRHAEAVTFLKDEITKAPGRSDLKVRLLEVLVETRDLDAFEREVSAFSDDSDVAKRLPDLRGQLGVANEEPSLDDLEIDLAADFGGGTKAPADDAPIEFDTSSLDDQSDDTLVLDASDSDESFDLEMPSDSDELSLDGMDDEAISFDLDEESKPAVAEDPEQKAELEAALNVAAAVDLSGTSTGQEESVDFGDIELDDASLEFEEVSERPAAEELDLSLDDLGLDDEDELSLESDDEDELSLEGDGDLSLEDTDSLSLDADDLDLGLDDDGLSLDASDDTEELSLDDLSDDDLSLSLEDEEATEIGLPAVEDSPAATVQREALDDLGATDIRSAVDAQDDDLSLEGDDDFDFLGDSDENATKLDLAKAYIDMGDAEGARDILGEVLSEGTAEQQAEARELISQVG